MRTVYSASIRDIERNGHSPGDLIPRSVVNSEKDHENDLGHCLPVRTRLGLAGGSQGCIKGAIVGGVAGHMAGHGKLGAAAGCVIGHHEANKQNPNNSNAQAPSARK